MRLLRRLPLGGFELISFDDENAPPYAILSHTWTEGQEVTYQELIAGATSDKEGYKKLCFCAERATADGLRYCWVDTCCIDKTTNNELTTAINSMFRWYQRASKCYVYLSDVSVPENLDAETFQITWLEAFRRSRWFTRGWTLQELLAPASVEFFSKEGKRLGSKISLKQEVCRSARLPAEVLRGQSLSKFSVEERLGWASTRTTTLKEDKVYCLLGIFEVFLPLIYGGGEAYATVRLKEEIRKRQNGKDLMNNNTSAVTARPNASPRPSCVVPFRQDPDFVDRGTLLEEIRKKCYAPASRVALVGLGGVGKSQLAIEHCYRTSERSPETWVFWVHASNAARIEQGYQAIADQVKISGRHDPQADVFQLVHNWLRNEENGKWLLVLDNVDDATVLALPASSKDGAHATPRSFTSYLPPSKHGAVLVTSRTRTAASHLVEDDEIIAIEPMNNVSAQALLRKKLGTESDERTTAELTTALECMPLAIVQAAAYIRQRAPRCSVQQYLADFHKSDRKKTSLLDYDGGRLRRDGDAKNSILLTWQISFDHIRDVRPSAADLLSLMSFFDRQGIPEEALRSQPEVKRSNESADPFKPDSDKSELEESIDNGFEDDISMLTSYFIVSLTTGGTAFDMHRLVQLATRRWLREQGKFEFWNDRFIGRLSAVFPKGNFKDWIRCQALFPHAKIALEQPPKSATSLKRWALLLHRAARYAVWMHNLSDAERLSTKSLSVRRQLFGETHRDTLSSMSRVGQVMSTAGRLAEAEELAVQVTETSKRVLGEEHPGTLKSMSSLTSVYGEQGRWKEAEKLGLQLMEIRKKVLGDEHPRTLKSMSNLASAYSNQGRWKEAERLGLQVMETQKRVPGDKHPYTLISMMSLALTFLNQGRSAEAEELGVQVTKMSKEVLGDKHPYSLVAMHNLACVLGYQHRTVEAIQLMETVVEARKEVLGVEHLSTLISSFVLSRWRQELCSFSS